MNFKDAVIQHGPNGSLGAGTLFPTSANGYSDFHNFLPSGTVTLDIVDNMGFPAPDGETYIIVTD